MTAQPGGPQQFGDVPPLDPGNHLLSPTPALWTTVVAQPAQGPKVLFTIRTPSTTLSLLLDKLDAERMSDDLARAAAGMSGLFVPGRGGPVAFG